MSQLSRCHTLQKFDHIRYCNLLQTSNDATLCDVSNVWKILAQTGWSFCQIAVFYFCNKRYKIQVKTAICSTMVVNSPDLTSMKGHAPTTSTAPHFFLCLCMKMPLIKSALWCYWQEPSVAAGSVWRLEIEMTSTAVKNIHCCEEQTLHQRPAETSRCFTAARNMNKSNLHSL